MQNIINTPLSDLKPGESATILALNNARQDTGRLIALGFTPAARVSMTQNYGHGPLIVTVRGTRVALGRGEAANIAIHRA